MPTPVPFELRIPNHEGKDFDEQMRSIERWAQQAPTGTTLLAKQTLTTIAASILITAIPQTYSMLRFVLISRSDDPSLAVNSLVRFNSDNGANYRIEQMDGVANVVAAQNNQVATEVAGNMPAGTASANFFGVIDGTIYNYSSTTQAKVCVSTTACLTGTAANDVILTRGNVWNSVNPITSILFLASAGNLVARSYAAIYGVF